MTTSGARDFDKQFDASAPVDSDLVTLRALGADWYWETDAEHRFSRITEGFRSRTGQDPEQFIGKSRLDFLRRQAERDANVAQHLQEIEAARPFRDFVYFLEDRQGRSRLISISGMPFNDESGKFAGYRGIGRDATGLLNGLGNGYGRSPSRGDIEGGSEDGSLAERLMMALNAIEDAFCYYDADGRLLLHNSALSTMFPELGDLLQPGVSFETLIRAALERGLFVTEGADEARLYEKLVSKRHEGAPSQIVFQLADGRWILHRTIVTADGGSIAIHTDITRHKQHQERLEQALKEAEAAKTRLQTGIDALEDGFVLWDKDDRLVAYNQAFQRQFAFMPEIEVGRTAHELLLRFAQSGVVAEAVGREEEWVRGNLAKREEELDQEIVFETHDNRWIMRRDRKTDGGDRVGIRTDITEQKQRELEIAEAKERTERLLDDMKRLVDAMRMGVVVLDADLNTEIINRAYFELWNVSPDEISVGISARELLDKARSRGVYDVPDDEWEDYVAARLESLRTGNVGEQEIRRADGGTMIYSVTKLSGGKRLVTYYDVTSLKAREAELAAATKRAEQLLQDLERTLDAVDLGVVLLDHELNALMINQAFYGMWSLTPEKAPRGIGFDVIMELNRHNGIYDVPDSEWEEFVGWRLDEIRGGHVAPREFARADGKTVIYSVTALSGGKRLVTYFDVSSLKQREAELAEALEKSRLAEAVIDSVPNPIFVKDHALEFVMVNNAFAQFFDTTPQQMIGKRAPDFVDAQDAADFEESEKDVLESGELFEIEEDYEEEGETRTRLVRKHRVATGSGRQYVACSIFDVTDMKRREMEAVETRRYLANVLEALPAGVIIYDGDDKFVLANKVLKEMLPGLEPVWQPGKTFREALELGHRIGYFRASGDPEVDSLYDTEPAAWLERYLERFRRKQTIYERRNPDGRWYQVFDIRTPDGSFVGVRVDISELKQREAELEEAEQKAVLADRAKSEFLANMSHEIRTPMNGVLGMAELLSKSELNAKQKTFTDIIMKSGNALLTIINDILDFSKIDAGQMVLDPVPFNLAEAIEDVATLMSTRAKEKDLEMIVRFQPGLPENHIGDVGRIRQIVTNLMGNAVKFTEAGHVLVEVTGEEVDGATQLKIAVTDTGIGIPADKVDQVFDKFSQVDTSSTRRHEGTGLGLAITSRLVEMMGGEIGVESVWGEGSTFWFTVTLPHAEEDRVPRITPIDVSGARVLVVDDNAINRSILMEQMTSWGFDSCAAENGAEGLRVLRAASSYGINVDCVVLDYQMPGMSGIDMARKMRSSEGIKDTPIVLLTSVDQALATGVNSELRFDAQLTKPARSSALLEALVETIQKRRARPLSLEHPVAAGGETVPSMANETPAARPRAYPAEQPAIVSPAEAIGDSQHRIDILVAEDNEVNQLVFTQILSETGLAFELVGNGAKAVEAWCEMNPRMILMDVSMPEMNGLEATGKIREMEEGTGRRTPIIGVTAHALKGDRERCLEGGMDDYLSKPISPKALLEKISKWIENGADPAGRPELSAAAVPASQLQATSPLCVEPCAAKISSST